MAIDEESRYQLYSKLQETLGPEEATTLMEYLPPVGWADVATKHDLDTLGASTKHDLDQLQADLARLERSVDARFDRMDARFDRIDARFDERHREMRSYLFTFAGIVVAFAGTLVAAIKI